MHLTNSFLVVLVSLILSLSAFASEHESGPEARLSGTTIITSDLELSVNFYTNVLGFRKTRIRQLSGSANLAVYGVTDENSTLNYTALLPAEWSKDNVYLSSLNLIEIDDALSSTLKRDVERAPVRSEIVLAYRVENIEEIMRRAESLDTPIVAPVSPSASGKSVTVTMLDPNGIRVYLYSYVDGME